MHSLHRDSTHVEVQIRVLAAVILGNNPAAYRIRRWLIHRTRRTFGQREKARLFRELNPSCPSHIQSSGVFDAVTRGKHQRCFFNKLVKTLYF